MRIIAKLAVGIGLTWWACSRIGWNFGYMSFDQAATVFLLVLAGSIINMHSVASRKQGD